MSEFVEAVQVMSIDETFLGAEDSRLEPGEIPFSGAGEINLSLAVYFNFSTAISVCIFMHGKLLLCSGSARPAQASACLQQGQTFRPRDTTTCFVRLTMSLSKLYRLYTMRS